MSSPAVHIKVLGGAGVWAVTVAEIAETQRKQVVRRLIIVFVRNLGSSFQIFEQVVGFAFRIHGG
jgi:accessory colonization factor AcfC